MSSILLNGQSWYVQTKGRPDFPALLLLHGFTGSHASWDALLSHWSQTFWTIAPDLPGHGRTPAPLNAQDLTMAGTADRLATLLDQLSIRSAAVLGYSMGGRLALHFAVQHGWRLSRLVLESASPGLDSPSERQLRRAQDRALADAIMRKGLDWFVPYWSQRPLFRDQPQWLVDEENRIRLSHTPFGLAQSLRGCGTGEQDSLWDMLPSLTMPVLLVTGQRDRKFAAIAERMARHIAHATWLSVDKAGHTVHGEQPAIFKGIVERFLKEHP